MLDKIEMRIPVDASLVDVDSEGKYCILAFDLLDLGINIASRCVYKDDEGDTKTQVLHHPYSQLPTSFTKMAFKFHHDGVNFPFVELKASPAKILQGHNVFGTDWIEEGALEMLGYLLEAAPTLYSILAIPEAEVMLIDVTYSARLKDNDQVEKVLDYLRNFSSRGIRKSTKQCTYKNTVYFGSERAKRLARKIYGKWCEFQNQLLEQKKLAAKNDKNAMRVVAVMEDVNLQKFAVGLLRFETGMKKYWLKEQGIPTNLFLLIQYQRNHPNILKELWLKANAEFFKALEGENMKATDHDSIYKKLCDTHFTMTKSGRISHTKARNLFNFYCALETHGCDAMKRRYSETRFYAYMKDLQLSGFSKMFLQNLHTEEKHNIIPFVRMVEINFDQQVPDWYEEPKSTFSKLKIA